MTKYLIDNYSDEYEIVVTFSNTGQEDERTLEFVHKCDKYFGFNTVWLEAVVNPEHGKGTTHKVVTFETADRNGQVYESYIAKDGIPNSTFPHCTRELKQRPMDSYTRSIGWRRGTYEVAIGIRADETRRVSKNATKDCIIYPLVDWLPTTKEDVLDWWEDQPFDLELKEHEGNCTWCWKKSLKKHAMLYRERPEVFDFPNRMEEKYGQIKTYDAGNNRVFFRGARSTKDVIKLIQITPIEALRPPLPEENSGCTESCEVYATGWPDCPITNPEHPDYKPPTL